MHILSDPVTVMITNMKFSEIFRCISQPGRPCVVPTSVNFWEMHLVQLRTKSSKFYILYLLRRWEMRTPELAQETPITVIQTAYFKNHQSEQKVNTSNFWSCTKTKWFYSRDNVSLFQGRCGAAARDDSFLHQSALSALMSDAPCVCVLMTNCVKLEPGLMTAMTGTRLSGAAQCSIAASCPDRNI